MDARGTDARCAGQVGIAISSCASRVEYSARIEGSGGVTNVRTVIKELAVAVAIRTVGQGVRDAGLPSGDGGKLPSAHERTDQTLLGTAKAPDYGDRTDVPAVEIGVAVV